MRLRTKVVSGGLGAVGLIAVPFVSDFEGLRTAAYLDPVGIPTICYGSTHGVRIGDQKTKAECDRLLETELLQYLVAVDTYVNVPMPDTRRAALTSFAYNVGIENFRRSTLVRLMNAGQTRAACDQLTRWVFAKGQFLRGLLRRREAERALCLQGTGGAA
jgi:lysozyme|nr:MAG TPA: endolysin R21 like protein [Caudoviricetes sp.]